MRDEWAERIWEQLTRIANSLEQIAPDQNPPEEPATCPHPREERISFGRTNGQEDWQCRLCGYRTPCQPLDPATTIPDPDPLRLATKG